MFTGGYITFLKCNFHMKPVSVFNAFFFFRSLIFLDSVAFYVKKSTAKTAIYSSFLRCEFDSLCDYTDHLVIQALHDI